MSEDRKDAWWSGETIAKLELELSELKARIEKVEARRQVWVEEGKRWESNPVIAEACYARVSALTDVLSILRGDP